MAASEQDSGLSLVDQSLNADKSKRDRPKGLIVRNTKPAPRAYPRLVVEEAPQIIEEKLEANNNNIFEAPKNIDLGVIDGHRSDDWAEQVVNLFTQPRKGDSMLIA